MVVKSKNKKVIYMPIEVEVRELVAKIFLATKAAKKGYKIIIGQKSILNNTLRMFPPGFYLSGGAFSNYVKFFKRVKEYGFKILVIEEEGLITYKRKMYLDMRIDNKCLELVDRYYLWGNHQLKMLLSKYNEFEKKFFITGNPRFDILSENSKKIYEKEINQIKQKYKDFCLICTCFPSINHFNVQEDFLETLKKRKTFKTKQSLNNYVKYQEIKRKTLLEFKEFINQYSILNPNINIVIRPHPGESEKPYLGLCKKYKNVFIDKNFSVHPWLISSLFLVHHYCTTSIEALALDTKRFSIRPQSFPEGEYEFPFDCSLTLKSGKEMAKIITENKNNLENIKENIKKNLYKKYVKNIIKFDASYQIVNDIDFSFKRFRVKKKNKKFAWFLNIFKRFYVLIFSNYYEIKRSTYEKNKLKKINKGIIIDYIIRIEGIESVDRYKILNLGKNLVSIEIKK